MTTGSYTKETLIDGETQLYNTRISKWVLAVAWIKTGGYLIGAIAAGIAGEMLLHSHGGWVLMLVPPFLMVDPYLAYKTSEIVITNRRVLIKVGFIQRRSLEMFLQKIETVGVFQNPLGRWLNYGSVSLCGTGGTQEVFHHIDNPVEFRNWVQKAQGGEKA